MINDLVISHDHDRSTLSLRKISSLIEGLDAKRDARNVSKILKHRNIRCHITRRGIGFHCSSIGIVKHRILICEVEHPNYHCQLSSRAGDDIRGKEELDNANDPRYDSSWGELTIEP